ncbi:MAG: carbohydrate binding family 9 domain-containing protein [Candidatus Aminicenantes bacterium]|nr:carbohydrate binding family 9 domain-containing protein [Candidatus Aminicenantes bacterium]
MRPARAVLPPFLVPLFLLIAPPANAQSVREASALKIDTPVRVDGALDEEAWAKAPALSDFVQFEPDRGVPATVRTVVRVLYDDRAVYFGFECFDPEQDRIAASLSKRDSDLREDDSVAVCLDTHADRRSAYFFMTNLLGTQYDGRISDNGLTTDNTWDGAWRSAARRNETGWTAELAVELACLKYNPGRGRTWGLGLGRVFPRRLESNFWQGLVESPYRVSQFGRLTGLDLEKASKALQVVPHVVGRLDDWRDAGAEAGLDARYAFSQTVSGDLTLNPDFATVEADQEQINLTRFALSLPEKRNFFLEGSEIYRQRIQLFYSRRIGDIYGGAKVYGKAGGFEFSGLSAQTKPNEETGLGSANFSVIRLKTDVLEDSSIGFLAANRLAGGRNSGTAGIDTSLNFTNAFRFTGQLAVSYGEATTSNIAFFLRPTIDTATFHFHVRYTQIGEFFGDNGNAVGFVRDDNRRELDSALSKTFWVKRGPLERFEYDSNYNIYWGMNGSLRSWQIDQGLELDFRNKMAVEIEHTEEYKLFEEEFRNRQTELTLGYNTREWQSARVSYAFGRNFGLDFDLVEGSVNHKLTRDLSLEYGLTRLIFDPDPEEESTWIHSLRATHHFTPDLFLKLYGQVNSAIDKTSVQLLFVYRFQPPFGLVQLAYQRGSTVFGVAGERADTLFMKFAWMF